MNKQIRIAALSLALLIFAGAAYADVYPPTFLYCTQKGDAYSCMPKPVPDPFYLISNGLGSPDIGKYQLTGATAGTAKTGLPVIYTYQPVPGSKISGAVLLGFAYTGMKADLKDPSWKKKGGYPGYYYYQCDITGPQSLPLYQCAFCKRLIDEVKK